jgi:uncharacterized membrane protein
MSPFTPAIAIHVTAALGALALGPLALWARRPGRTRPQLHRAAGYAWVTLMVTAAVSALWIRGGRLPNIAGFSPIHLLVPLTLLGLVGAFAHLGRGNVGAHRKIMLSLYFGACVTAGVFTLLPDRLLGQLVWGEWLGLLPASAMGSHEAHRVAQGLLVQVLGRTPPWVWALLAGLLVLGLSQTRERTAGMARVASLPLAMGAFSLFGLVSDFGTRPPLLALWATATLAIGLPLARRAAPQRVSFDAQRRRFTLPGSWVPMALILGIFLTKYAVGASLTLQPALKSEPAFALTVAALSGVFSGLFAGRALQLLRLARQQDAGWHLRGLQLQRDPW